LPPPKALVTVGPRGAARRLSELVGLDFVRLALRGVGQGVAHQRLQRHNITAALPQETI